MIKELEEMSHVKNLGLRGRNCAFGGGGVCCTFRKPKKVPDVNFRAVMSRSLNVHKFTGPGQNLRMSQEIRRGVNPGRPPGPGALT